MFYQMGDETISRKAISLVKSDVFWDPGPWGTIKIIEDVKMSKL